MKEKLMTLLSEIDKKSLKKILIWGFLSAVAKALPYMFIIMSAAELIKPLAGGTINKKMLIIYCIMMIASYIIMYIFSMKSWITISYDAASIVKNGRNSTLSSFNSFPVGKILEKDTNEITGYVVDDHENFLLVISDILDPILHSIVMPVLGFIAMLFISWQLDLIALAVAVLSFAIYFAMQKNLSMFLLFMFIKGVFAGTLSGSLNALIAEASGYTTRTTGVHMDGMMYSCSSLGVKVGGGIGTAAVGWLLKLGGFVGTATVQSESAIRMIFNLYITFPFVIGIIITVLLAFLDVEKANKKWDAEHKKEAQA